MTRKEFDEVRFDDLMIWALYNLNDITTKEMLIEYAIDNIRSNHIFLAIHILQSIDDAIYYKYDYSMGTLETPEAITGKEDIEDLIEFDELEGDEEDE